MSTQGQGDGGVYVSTQGPASYGLGTDDYEVNIIKDCFGVERVDEYLGKGKLDVVLVYACEARTLQQAPGGRDNAKMISKSTFKDFSLEHHHNYFLRPDRIFGAFYIDPTNRPIIEDIEMVSEMVVEKDRENLVGDKFRLVEKNYIKNIERIDEQIRLLWDPIEKLKVIESISPKTSSHTNNNNNRSSQILNTEKVGFNFSSYSKKASRSSLFFMSSPRASSTPSSSSFPKANDGVSTTTDLEMSSAISPLSYSQNGESI